MKITEIISILSSSTYADKLGIYAFDSTQKILNDLVVYKCLLDINLFVYVFERLQIFNDFEIGLDV